ncbi:MAG: DUF2321 domain-containing protein [bacterium]|nr:DUF2321 domain-containing protein [bacterium]
MFQEIRDVAQICLNGHIVNASSLSEPQYCEKFCQRCGAETIISCPNCNVKISGESRIIKIYLTHPSSIQSKRELFGPPAYCKNCGKPFPWTESKLKAAHDLTNELEKITDDEKITLHTALDEIVKDTPQTEIASFRFKKILGKLGKPANEIFKRVLMEIMAPRCFKWVKRI